MRTTGEAGHHREVRPGRQRLSLALAVAAWIMPRERLLAPRLLRDGFRTPYAQLSGPG